MINTPNAYAIKTILCAFSLFALAQSDYALAQTTSTSKASANNSVTSIEIVGDRAKASGPQCVYLNLATLRLKASAGLVVANGNVNGRSETMLVDTGTLHSQLAKDEATKLGLSLAHTKLTQNTVNGDVPVFAAMIDDLGLDKFFWHRFMLAVVPKASQSFGLLAGADVLLNGLNKDVELSLSTGQMKIFVPSGCDNSFLAYWDHEALTAPLVDLSTSDPRQILTVRVNGKEMTALIDSGTPTSIISLEAAARAGITPESPGVAEMSTGFTAGKQSGKVWLAKFRTFSIGDEIIQNPEIAISDVWGDSSVVHSTDTLSAFRQMSLVPATVGAMGLPSTPATEAKGRVASIGSQIEPTVRPDMLLGADFLRSHRVLMAISQRQLYFSYVGGKVFDNGGAPSTRSVPGAGNGVSVIRLPAGADLSANP